MKKATLVLTIILSYTLAYAVPALNLPIEVTQPDGTKITIRLYGDEHFNYATSEDGYLIKEAEDGFYKFATMTEDGAIAVSKFVCKPISKRTNEEKVFLQNIAKKNKFNEIVAKVAPIRRQQSMIIGTGSPQRIGGYVGGDKYLVILIGYSDLEFSSTREAFDNMLNQKGYSVSGAEGSAKDYFEFSSNSKFSPQFDVVGPYKAPKNMEYYGADGYDANGNKKIDLRAGELIVEACKLAMNAGVDLKQYDTNNDSFIDNVCIFYAGYGTAEGGSNNAIWPHCFRVRGTPVVGSVRVRDYVVMPEFRGGSGKKMAGIGTFCHEFSHFLGLPDFYKTDGSNESTLNNWDLMDAGCYNGPNERGDVPCGYSAYERFFMGWLTPTPLTNSDTYKLNPLSSTTPEAYLVSQKEDGSHNLDGQNPNPVNFYLLENRKKESFDKYLPANGMLIWRVMYNKTAWEYNKPNNTLPYRMDIMEADSIPGKNTLSGDTYPRPNATGFKFVSSDNKPWNNRQVSEITKNGDIIQFVFDNGNGDNKNSGNNEPFTIGISTDNSWIITAATSGNYRVHIFSLSSQLISSKDFSDKIELSTSGLAKGGYQIIIENLSVKGKNRFTSIPIVK
ncbi:hypothetical protein HW49_09975 [Porphyromonadaceae bacterium COT-184 OH4590]|nr:hypothetical protein HW49_09975 [Porphyromonadaceae bacterium COT-184 OH4590]